MKSLAKGVLDKTNIVREYSHKSATDNLGEHESTVELWGNDGDDTYEIEWDIPSLEETEHIGIWCGEGTKEMCDYDGVFEIPKPIIAWLEELGFNCDYCKD